MFSNNCNSNEILEDFWPEKKKYFTAGIAEICTYVPFKITNLDNGFCFVSLFSLSVVSLFVFVYFIIVTIVMSYSSFPLLSILVFWCEIYQRRFQNHVKSLRWSILWKLSTAFSCWQFSQNAQSRTLGRFWILNRIYNVVFQNSYK